MAKITTLYDARIAKHDADRPSAEARRAAAHAARFVVPADLHPAIGVLTTARGVRFYAYIGQVETFGTVESLTAALTEAGR